MANVRKSKQAKFTGHALYKEFDAKQKFLADAVLSLKNKDEVAAFFRDLMTAAEIEEFSNRLEIARLLKEGHSYQIVSKKTGVSTTTVTRVSQWLFSGAGGYQKVLERLVKK